MEDSYRDRAKIFKAFCDENRLRILELLKSGEKCACTLLEELDIAQSTLSHHMKILNDSGVIISRKEGKWMYYALRDEGIRQAKNMMAFFMKKDKDYELSCTCNGE